MEGGEMEMSEEELQKWIREEVHKSELISPGVLENLNLLQSLLERREKQAAHLLKLCESVAACEAVVKKQYSLLGWEYRDTDSDDDDNITDFGHSPPSPCNSVNSETNGPTPLLPKLQDTGNVKSYHGKNSLIRESVVVLTRLPECTIGALGPTATSNDCIDDESLSSSDSDMQWEPEDDSNDSDFSISSVKTGSKKRRKIDEKNEKHAKSGATPQARTNTSVKSNTTKTSTPKASTAPDAKNNKAKTSSPKTSTNSDAKSSTAKPSTPQTGTNSSGKSNRAKTSSPKTSTNSDAKSSTAKPSTPQTGTNSSGKSNRAKTSTPEDNRDANTKSSATKTSTASKNINGVTPGCTVATLRQSDETTKTPPPKAPLGEVRVNMRVLARRKGLNWLHGEIVEILTKEDGRVKYKINFEEKGKSLVSGHHIAFECMPKVEQLKVGARVVVKCTGDQPKFCPGILAELPCRKNRMRFLVFIDDHTPIYVGLPLLHLVCRPLEDACDDIPDDTHKNFMKEYLKIWPYPPQTQYKVGQMINAELDGVQQRCKVELVDCSLIQVVFQKDQRKEWIYRGSIRLEHMIHLRENVELRKEEGYKKNWLTSTKTVSR